MPKVDPFWAKLITFVLCVAAVVLGAYFPDAKEDLQKLAAGLAGWQFLPRAGDAPARDAGSKMDDGF